MTIDRSRMLRAFALGAWALFFNWLWLSGHGASYAAPRTAWVITFGAIALSIATVAYLLTARTAHPGPGPSWRELAATTALVGTRPGSDAVAGTHPAASGSPEYAGARGMRPGRLVRLIGPVSEEYRNGSFVLVRFQASCCAADAIPTAPRSPRPGCGR